MQQHKVQYEDILGDLTFSGYHPAHENLRRALGLIERLVGRNYQGLVGLVLAEIYHEILFPKVALCLVALCDALNSHIREAASRGDVQNKVGRLEGFLALPLGQGNLTLLECGLRRNTTGQWELNYRALNDRLLIATDSVVAMLDEFAIIHLAPFLRERAAVTGLTSRRQSFNAPDVNGSLTNASY